MKRFLFYISFLWCVIASSFGTGILSPWKEGYLDIHHINTGRGESTFCILPDGTTLLIDMGEMDFHSVRNVPVRPDTTITAAHVVADYIKTICHKDAIDYCFLTHYHVDHVGGIRKNKSPQGYYLSGITELASLLPVKKIIDKGLDIYPFEKDSTFYNYKLFIEKSHANRENFVVGSNTQISLQHDKDSKYRNFEIRNVAGNGIIWTGKGDATRKIMPELSQIKKADIPGANTLSCGIRMKYGNFSYLSMGDLTGYPKPGQPQWHDMETPLAPQLGHIEVYKVSHHGYNNATNENLLKSITPQVFVILAVNALHPNHSTLERIYSKRIYPGNRYVYQTGMNECTKVVIGDMVNRNISNQGHVVIRVEPDTKSYKVYVLDDIKNDGTVVSEHGPYFCK